MSLADSTQDIGLDAGLNKSDTKEVTESPKDIGKSLLLFSCFRFANSCLVVVDSAQDVGLDAGLNESDHKNEVAASSKDIGKFS